MPDRRSSEPLTHDRRKNNKLHLNSRQNRMIGKKQTVDNHLLQPLEVRPVGAPGREDGLKVLAVELLDERRAALLGRFVELRCGPVVVVQ